MTLFGLVLTLGVGQAVAQVPEPTVETATYVAGSAVVTITTSAPVFFGGDDATFLPTDFVLTQTPTTGTATTRTPFRIDGLASTNSSADDSFNLVFDMDIEDFRTTGAALALAYTQDTDDATSRIVTTARTALASFTGQVVTGPDEEAALTLMLTAAEKTQLQMARMIGTVLKPNGDELAPSDTATGNGIILPEAERPGTGTVAYALGPASALADLGGAAALAFDPSTRALTGTLTTVPVSRQLEYTATEETNQAIVLFTINVANKPDAPGTVSVVAAGPSSLTVSWGAPKANNAAITRYELQYKAEGATDWSPALDLPDSIVASRKHVIEGLAPGTYDVQVRAHNALGMSDWAAGKGTTGAAPGKPTLSLDVTSTMAEGEGRGGYPVTVRATVPPGSDPTGLKVTLTLGVAGPAEDRAELPTGVAAGIPADMKWTGGGAAGKTANNRVLTLNFNGEAETTLETLTDVDAEDEKFSIAASAAAVPGVFAAATGAKKDITIEDAEEQVYALQLDSVTLENDPMFDEGNGDEPVGMKLIVSPGRTRPKSFFVNLESMQDASDYSLSSGGTSSGGPTAVSLRIDMDAGQESESISLTAASNDGDRMDDTITLQLFETSAASPTTAGNMVPDGGLMLKVIDQHKLPDVTMGSIMVDGAEATSLMEGETGTVTLMADRGTVGDAVPDGEKITVALTHGAASSASAADYSLSSEMVTITGTSGTFMLEVLADDEIDAEELVLMAEVTGEAMYGDEANDEADMVTLGPISLEDGTTKLVYPKTKEEIEAVIYPAMEAGRGDDMMFNPGETIEIAMPGSLFNTNGEGVTLSFTAESDNEDVATVAVSGGGMVTVTAQDMAGVVAHITITAHASMPSGAMPLPQTDPSEASVIFPVEVGLEALSFTLSDPEDMNLVEGMSAMVTATANRAVTDDVTINLMRDRAMSTAGDDDYMAEAITIEAGMMSGTTMVMAVEDDMMENEGNMQEELVLYGMAADNAGEVSGQVKFYIWDAAVPALPIIAQLLLAAFLAFGGYRRYRRR